LKKKRSKPNSSKKNDKDRPSSEPFNDPVVMKNYRSANLTSNPAKIVNSKQIDSTKKRYQYHKRIRSDTGHTIINPLEQMYERSKKYKNDFGIPLTSNANADIQPTMPITLSGDDQRYNVLDSKPTMSLVNNPNTIQMNKYEFAPSFSQHKNIITDSNSHYRKFKTNKSTSLSASSNPKNQPTKIPEKKSISYSQISSKSHTRKPSKVCSIKNEHPYDYSPKQPVSSDPENNYDDGVIKESSNEYRYDNDQVGIEKKQSKFEVKKTLQLVGDRSISMSKETEEIRNSESKPLTATPDHLSSKLGSKRSSDLVKLSSDEQFDKLDEIQAFLLNETLEISPKDGNKATTKIVQIDCEHLDPLETTKSKDDLVNEIKNIIIDSGKEPETKSRFYRVGKLLGRGAFGKVSLGMHKVTNQLVAIKSINKEFLEEERSRRKVAREVAILKKLQHPNIINLYETFETEKHFLLVTELCPGGDLLNYVRRRRKLTEDVAKYFFKQLVHA
jgi:hypothetical protein